MPVHLERKKYDPGSRDIAGWILPMGSATDLNSSVPTQVEAKRGVKTMWFRGETQTTSYVFVSRPFMSLQPAHPDPKTTTLGFSPVFVGPKPARGVTGGVSSWVGAAELKCAREASVGKGNGFIFLGLMDDDGNDLVTEIWMRFLNQAIFWFITVFSQMGISEISVSV